MEEGVRSGSREDGMASASQEECWTRKEQQTEESKKGADTTTARDNKEYFFRSLLNMRRENIMRASKWA